MRQKINIDHEGALKMLMDGKTFEEVGKKYGVSKQAVYQHFMKSRHVGKRRSRQMKYAGIEEWMNRESITYREVTQMVYQTENPDRSASGAIRRILIGQQENVKIWLIKRILEVSQMTFEEAFRTEEETDAAETD